MKTLVIIPNDEKGKSKDEIFRGIGSFNVLGYTANTLTINRGITATERGFINNIGEVNNVDIIIIQMTDEQAESYNDRVIFIDIANAEEKL